MTEKDLQKAVCKYLMYQYNGIMFNSDLAGATKLTIGQASSMKNLRSNRGFPDLAIYKPIGKYHGLFIELKIEGTKLYKKNGDPATPHISEQLDCLLRLEKEGYFCAFAIGFDQAINLINNYLTGKL